ncbi:MAG TPA: LysM domain-containing protein [Acidimicrobiales bacterium]|nr:LysM domain-containing protein [Acidimicrobiales bacterium]
MALAVRPGATALGAWSKPEERPCLRLVEGQLVEGQRRGEARRGETACAGYRRQRQGERLSPSERRRWIAGALVAALALAALALPLRVLGARVSAAGPAIAGRVGAPGQGAPPAASLPVEVAAGAGTYYVVRPGDTLRSIASRLDPGDPARAVAALASVLGSDHVVPGEHVPVPGAYLPGP